VLLGEARVAYEFTRGPRRTIGFVIGIEGLSVRAPRWLALNDVDRAVRDKAGWMTRQARALFTERLDHFAPRIGVRWNKLALSNAATRWGSASSTGAIRLHWRLMHFHLEVIDYVVVHELSHLRAMDHSPRFWATVEAVMPNYPALRRQLKDETVPRW